MAPPKTPNQPRGTVLGSVQSGLVTFTLRATPMPSSLTSFLTANANTIKRIQRDRRGGKAEDDSEAVSEVPEGAEVVSPEDFWPKFEQVLQQAGRDWTGLAEQVWAFGPRRIGPNLLVDRTSGSPRSCVPPDPLQSRSRMLTQTLLE